MGTWKQIAFSFRELVFVTPGILNHFKIDILEDYAVE